MKDWIREIEPSTDGKWVCWSREMAIRNGYAVVHVQGDGNRTLCGIRYGLSWDFDKHGCVTCSRCRRILRSASKQEA